MSSGRFAPVALLAWFTVIAAAQSPSTPRPLALGKPVQRQLAGGQSHTYSFSLHSGQYAHVLVDQRGIDVVLTVFDPDNKKLASIDRWSDLQGEESISLVAESMGDYRLEVRSESKDVLPGQYEIKLAQVRAPVAIDLKRIAAERSYAAGDELNGEGSAEGHRRAIEKLEESLSLWKEVDDPLWKATTLLYLGLIHYDFGETREANEYYTQALPLWRIARNRSGEGATLSSIGRAYDSLGDYQKALDFYNESLPLLRAADERGWESHVVHNLGMTYLSLGESQKALEYYDKALQLESRANSIAGRAHILHHIGEVHLRTDAPQKSLQYLDQALRLSRSVADHLGEATALNHLGRAHDLLGHPKESLENYNQALMLQRAAGYRLGEAQTLANIGMLYQSLGSAKLALDTYSQALVINQAIGDQRGEASTLSKIAEVHAGLGDLTNARAEAESCIRIVESLRAKVATPELRASYFSTTHDYYETYVDILMRLQKAHPLEGHEAEALAASERAKARVLLESLREARAEIHRGVDPVLLDRDLSLRRQIDAKADYNIRLLSGRHTEQEAAAVQMQIDDLLTQYQGVEARMRETSGSYSALTQPQPISAREIQEQVVDATTLLLEYSIGEERSYLWAVTPNSISSFELPKRTEIEGAVRRFRDLLIARNVQRIGEAPEQKRRRLRQAEAEYPVASAALGQMLLGPVSSLLSEKRLLIVGDGVLDYVPFAALPEDGKATPLIVHHEIINLPSASTLGVLRRELDGRSPAPKTVAVLADPVFERSDSRLIARRNATVSASLNAATTRSATASRVIDGSLRLPRLPFTRQEADTIISLARSGDAMEALDFDAGRDRATGGELAMYRFVHFATQGVLNAAHPELSGLVLSLFDRRGTPQNGFLKLQDVYNLNLPAELVVLSACETGLGREIKGEGLIGITRGFMYAGAKRVVASLWSVNDVATAALMGHFYESMLAAGSAPAAALRSAQIAMMDQKRWASPYYWAAFTIEGDWK